jgi:predicted nucleic-acid-binding Zn-ribbon protein
MKNGKCPKCDSTNVFMNRSGVEWGDEGGWIDVWIGSPDSRSGKQSEYDSYICVDCGYFENYILDRDILHEVQTKWTRVK